MNVSQDTKCGPSVVAESLQSLTDQAKLCRQKIDLLEAGQNTNRAEVLVEIGKLLDLCQNLRDAILSEDSTATWSSKAELGSVISRLEVTATKRRRYLDLAQVLGSGTVVHRRERTRLERLALRDAAVGELLEISERSNPPELPGPAVEEWLEWACGLEDESDEQELQKLKASFPRLDDFVRQLEIDWWQQDPAASGHRSIAVPKSSATNGANGAHSAANGSNLLAKQAPDAEEIHAAPALEVEADLHVKNAGIVREEQAVAIEGQASDAALEILSGDFALTLSGEEVQIPAEMLSPSRKGKVSLFPWDQVEQFTQAIERAKVERKDARTIRALIAVSQWIEPATRNPVFHPKCGICAITGYPEISAPSVVSPSDVTQAISLDDGLPLLTGGADLLRWGLLQPAERSFQGIASIRRLSSDHLKAWFSELYRIALSDKQIDDICNLTSGIPYLVGELHKLIIPLPDDPPTWLGLARWMDIKAQFEKQIPEFAHELKKGVPSVRLTDRELSLLNMVAIVSNGSTAETIAADLSDNWERFEHPEYRAFSSRDEVSLEVLLDLGLLPKRNVTGVAPSRCLLPVKQDDVIHKLVEHL